MSNSNVMPLASSQRCASFHRWGWRVFQCRILKAHQCVYVYHKYIQICWKCIGFITFLSILNMIWTSLLLFNLCLNFCVAHHHTCLTMCDSGQVLGLDSCFGKLAIRSRCHRCLLCPHLNNRHLDYCLSESPNKSYLPSVGSKYCNAQKIATSWWNIQFHAPFTSLRN